MRALSDVRAGAGGRLATARAKISNDPTLVGAIGNISAKSGTTVGLADGDGNGFQLRTRASSGYIESRSGRRLVFTLAVSNVGPVEEIPALIEVFEDSDVISTILWKLL